MFSKNNAYQYEQIENDIFERELPYKSIKIPYRKGLNRVLRYSQQKQQLEELKQQIMAKCKFQEVQYLEMMKKQREVMEEDIKKRREILEKRRAEEILDQNKKINDRNQKKVKDSLDRLQKEEEERRIRAKSERSSSAYSSEMGSINEPYVKTVRPASKKTEENLLDQLRAGKDIKTEQMKKEDQIQKIKQQMLEKYKFIGETGKKPKKAAQEIQDRTMVNMWIQRVRQFREQEIKKTGKKLEPEPQSSDSESEYLSEDRRAQHSKKSSRR